MLRDGYDVIGYNENTPIGNPIAELTERLREGEVELIYQEGSGYLEALLQTLGISPASQMLVFSKTSLQHDLISTQTPRALYFSEDTYIGWVQNSSIIEIMTLDDQLGMVFYIFNNSLDSVETFERDDQRCLVCHDSNGTMGGGVPLLMALSAVYSERGINVLDTGGNNIDDSSPIRERWGGWYVTGHHGSQKHLGNIQLPENVELNQLDSFRTTDLDALSELNLFDSTPYLEDTSDIVALMVLEHQLTVQNQITYIKFKAPAVMERIGLEEVAEDTSWDSLPPRAQQSLTRMLNKLVQLLFFSDAATFEDNISGTPAFEKWFQSQGIEDGTGRSLREFDLENQLFKYPLSYLIYSDGINHLPDYARQYVFQKIAAILEGKDNDEAFSHISSNERQIVLDILRSTKEDFLPYLSNE